MVQGPEVYDAVMKAGREFGIRRLGSRTVMINHLEACFPTGGWHYLDARYPWTGEYAEYIEKEHGIYGGLGAKLTGSFASDDIRDYYRTPVELGWTKNIKFDHEFTGRTALEREVADPKRTIVTLELNSEDMIDIYASLFREGEPYDFMDMPYEPHWMVWNDKVLKDGKPVGVSTVPGYSYFFRKVLTLTVIDVKLSAPGEEVTVVWGNPGTPQKNIRATVAPAPYKKDNRRVDLTGV